VTDHVWICVKLTGQTNGYVAVLILLSFT
jgi:hypothetical protein